MAIYIVQGIRNLRRILDHDKLPSTDTHYIICDGNEESEKLLLNKGVSGIILERLDEGAREQFLREYIDLIGTISKKCNTREWWATDISSKNRETSRIPFLLHEFISIINAITKVEGRDLLIVNSSLVLFDSLMAYLKKNNIPYHYLSDSIIVWREICSRHIILMMRVLYVLMSISIRKIYFTLTLRTRTKALSKRNKYYVVKTFIYNHSFKDDGSYKDVFFGALPDYLSERENVLILAHILGKVRLCTESIRRCESHTIYPLEILLSITDSIKAAFRIIFARIQCGNSLYFMGHDVSGIVNKELKRTQNGISLYQYLHYDLMRRLLESVKVDAFLLTYENNPWEKMCMKAIRDYSPGTAMIGYQHSVVPQASANAFISRKEKDIIPMPDKILTVGKVPKEIMEKYGSYDSGKIKAACGLRFEYLLNISPSTRQKRGNILLVGEGLYGVYELVNYVIKELSGNTNYQVRIRTHPELPIEKFEKKLIVPLNTIQNFSLSENRSIKDDLEWADMIVYWGSTVSLEALCMGKPIIRYDMDFVFSYDPLFECNHLKWVVRDETSLVNTIEEIYELDNESFENARKNARQYIENYFFPVTKDSMALFLRAD